MTVVIKYTQGSGPTSITLRGCASEADGIAQFWAMSHIKSNSKTAIVSVNSY